MSTLSKKQIQLEAEIERARYDKDWITLSNLIKKYNKLNIEHHEPLELLIKAEKSLSESNYNEALDTLNKAHSTSSDNQEVLSYLGIIEYEKNDIVKALSYLNKVTVNQFLTNSTSRRIGLLIQVLTIKGKCYENQGNFVEALSSYQAVIDVTFRYYKNFKLIDKQTKLYFEESFIRVALIQKYFGNIQISIKHLRSCLSSQIGLSRNTFRISLTTLAHLLLRNVCSVSYIPALDSSNETTTYSGIHPSKQFYIPSDEVEEGILSLLYAETLISQQQQQQLQQQQQQQFLTPINNNTPISNTINNNNQSNPTSPTINGILHHHHHHHHDSNGKSTDSTSTLSTSEINHHLHSHQGYNQFIEAEDTCYIYDDICLGYSRREQYYPIVETFEKSLVLDFNDSHKWIQLALSLYAAGKYKRSLFIIEECLSKDSKNITLLLLASKICINHLNQITKAVLFAKQAISYIDSEDTTSLSKAYLLMGIAYSKKAIECKSSHEKIQNQELALSSLKNAYEIDPYDYRNSYHLSLIYADFRDTSMALKYIHEALQLNSNDSSCWSLLTLLLSSNKNYELAYRTCNYALTQSPTNIDLLLIKAKLELALDDGSQALITYKSVFQFLVSKSLTSNEDFDDSVSLPRNRNQSGPSSVVSFDLRSGTTAGDSRSHRSNTISATDMESAIRDFEDSPTSPKDLLRTTTSSSSSNTSGISSKEIHRNISLWLSLSEAFTQQRMFKDAAHCLAQAESIDSNSADVYYHQGYLMETQDLTNKAISLYQKALTIDSSHTNSLIRLALHYFRENDLLLAENNLTAILRSNDPASHLAWFQLGLVLKAKGEIERSSDCFKKAIELDSTSPLIPYYQISRYA